MASDCEKMAITTTTETPTDEEYDDDVFLPPSNDINQNAKKSKKTYCPINAKNTFQQSNSRFVPSLSQTLPQKQQAPSPPNHQQQQQQQQEQQQPKAMPPPPPPPPASPSPSPPAGCTHFNKFIIPKCKWAHIYPGVQIASYLANVCTIFPPKEFKLKCIKPIIQNGPTCGLVALSMLLNGPSDGKLLELAIENKFSNHGEMFSVGNMIKLMTLALMEKEHNPQPKHPKIQYTIHTKKLNCKIIRRSLQDGACLLVPYDSDVDHTPCLKNGHKAHWALIVGYLIDDDNEFYVFSRHGKTKHLALWPLKELSASNSNLAEMVKPSNYTDADFIIPYFGIDGEDGLNQKSIIIHGLKYKEMKLP